MNIDISSERDVLVMKLFHYFITKKNYTPIVIRGVDNEIWLENSKEEFNIVRIVTKEIYNNEQYEFDIFKIRNIISQIKKKTFNPFVKVLTIYIGQGVNFDEKNIDNTSKYKFVLINNEEDLYKNEIIKKYYKDMKKNMIFDEEGYQLIGKMASDISQKNIEDNERYNNMFKQKRPIITYILIAINIIVFILMYIIGNGSEDTDTLIKFGADYAPLTKNGEYYRLITNAFLHIGVIHLLCNMYALFTLGPTLEHFFGKVKFLIIYFYSAIIASLFTLVLQDPNTVSAGASGAIFGLFGALLYFGYNYRGYIGNQLINQIIPVVLINLYIGFTVPGISNAAHIGGLVGGVVITSMLGTGIDESKSKRINGLIIALVFTAFMIYLSFFK